MEELNMILEHFAAFGWDLVAVFSRQRLEESCEKAALIPANRMAELRALHYAAGRVLPRLRRGGEPRLCHRPVQPCAWQCGTLLEVYEICLCPVCGERHI